MNAERLASICPNRTCGANLIHRPMGVWCPKCRWWLEYLMGGARFVFVGRRPR